MGVPRPISENCGNSLPEDLAFAPVVADLSHDVSDRMPRQFHHDQTDGEPEKDLHDYGAPIRDQNAPEEGVDDDER